MKKYNIGLFIFHRDLRLDDNHGLINLLEICENVIPIFILDKNQIVKNEYNKYYFSNNAVQFICESLENLNEELNKYKSKLHLFFGKPENIFMKIIKQFDFNDICVSWNKDYSKYALKRDKLLGDICIKYNINFIECETDFTLIPFECLIKKDNNAFKQFGAFYKNAVKTVPTKPQKNKYKNYKRIKFDNEFIKKLDIFYDNNENIAQHGGRKLVLNRLHNIQKYKDYNTNRDCLNYKTTNISAALNMGCISIREVYDIFLNKLGKNNDLIKQLYWRDFYLAATKYIPYANSLNRHMDERYDNIQWDNKKSDWEKIWYSKTGFLLIDAAMKELQITGYMHGRARMLCGIMWTKYLLINPLNLQYGSQTGYSRLLVDAIGMSQNKMNHSWLTEFDLSGRRYAQGGVALSGRPMDISNKMIKKWDKDCNYIKKWLPDLKDIPSKDLYNWNVEIAKKYNNIHPSPIFDPKDKYQEWINRCRMV